MEIRLATHADLDSLMVVFVGAKKIMRDSGNLQQWNGGYPSREVVSGDIENGHCHILCDGDRILGTMALLPGPDPTYSYIEGEWPDDEPYYVIHRIATSAPGRNVARFMFDWAFELISRKGCKVIRIDTHKDNCIMKHILPAYGFRMCGVIYLENGDPRDAYHLRKHVGGISDENTALVLEGGGLRGVFTCGVLDCFMDHGIRFPFTVGVSAGACNGLSYMSGQRGRAKTSNIDLMDKYNYVGLKYLFTQGCIMDFKLLFEDFPEKIIPYDYESYFSNPDRFAMVTTNCLTGKAEYFEEKSSAERIMEIVRASSSLPFVSPISYVDGIPMLDGGITDSIPVEYAMSQGYRKLVVVTTRNKGYRKKKSSMPLARLMYRKYPALQKAISDRNEVYNRTMDLIESLEAEGRITVIRPLRKIEVGRMEKDINKLIKLYNEGYSIAEKILLSKFA